jgi:hypothetical protein
MGSCDLSHEVMVSYVLICTGRPYVNGRCNGYEVTGNLTKYRINRARAEVVSLTGVGYAIPITLINCSIMDKKNWECSYQDGSGTVIMVDGLQQNPDPNHRYVRRWDYYIVKIKNYF